jgi:hypothetical protein
LGGADALDAAPGAAEVTEFSVEIPPIEPDPPVMRPCIRCEESKPIGSFNDRISYDTCTACLNVR